MPKTKTPKFRLCRMASQALFRIPEKLNNYSYWEVNTSFGANTSTSSDPSSVVSLSGALITLGGGLSPALQIGVRVWYSRDHI